MKPPICGSEAQENGRKSQDRLEARADRHRAAFPYVQRRCAECGLDCPCRGLCCRVVDWSQAGVAVAETLDRISHRLWRHPSNVVGNDLEGLLRVLVGHQTAADLGMGVSRDDCLWPFALETAPDAVNVQRRASAAALQRGEAGLAEVR